MIHVVKILHQYHYDILTTCHLSNFKLHADCQLSCTPCLNLSHASVSPLLAYLLLFSQPADLPILCHRHTTSKLSSFEDLETIRTLGFRGEALCSISFVSHMTVTSMTAGAQHGHRAVFKV